MGPFDLMTPFKGTGPLKVKNVKILKNSDKIKDYRRFLQGP